MLERAFGPSGTKVSVATFGSMRLPMSTEEDAARFLGAVWDAGITTFHSSAEYETHALFCAALTRLRQERPEVRPVHVAKLAAPHFEDPQEFSAQVFRDRVEEQLRALGTERLDVVQWLLRSKPISDAPRLHMLQASRDALTTLWRQLRQEGKVSSLGSFPYSMPFAERVIEVEPCAGLVTYLNLAELETLPLLSKLHGSGRSLMAIRPLAAGRLSGRLWGEQPSAPDAALRRTCEQLGLGPTTAAAFALRFPLLHPAVSSIVVSVSSREHLRIVRDALQTASFDESQFYETAQKFANPS